MTPPKVILAVTSVLLISFARSENINIDFNTIDNSKCGAENGWKSVHLDNLNDPKYSVLKASSFSCASFQINVSPGTLVLLVYVDAVSNSRIEVLVHDNDDLIHNYTYDKTKIDFEQGWHAIHLSIDKETTVYVTLLGFCQDGDNVLLKSIKYNDNTLTYAESDRPGNDDAYLLDQLKNYTNKATKETKNLPNEYFNIQGISILTDDINDNQEGVVNDEVNEDEEEETSTIAPTTEESAGNGDEGQDNSEITTNAPVSEEEPGNESEGEDNIGENTTDPATTEEESENGDDEEENDGVNTTDIPTTDGESDNEGEGEENSGETTTDTPTTEGGENSGETTTATPTTEEDPDNEGEGEENSGETSTDTPTTEGESGNEDDEEEENDEITTTETPTTEEEPENEGEGEENAGETTTDAPTTEGESGNEDEEEEINGKTTETPTTEQETDNGGEEEENSGETTTDKPTTEQETGNGGEEEDNNGTTNAPDTEEPTDAPSTDNNSQSVWNIWTITLVSVASVTLVAMVIVGAYYLGKNSGRGITAPIDLSDLEAPRIIPRARTNRPPYQRFGSEFGGSSTDREL